MNICLRSGNHCAQPFLRSLGIDSTLRMSISIYNEKSDIDALIDGLIKINEMFKKYNKES